MSTKLEEGYKDAFKKGFEKGSYYKQEIMIIKLIKIELFSDEQIAKAAGTTIKEVKRCDIFFTSQTPKYFILSSPILNIANFYSHKFIKNETSSIVM